MGILAARGLDEFIANSISYLAIEQSLNQRISSYCETRATESGANLFTTKKWYCKFEDP